jgi:hypothetical protein
MRNEPFKGTWKLNIPASTLPFAAPRSVLLNIEVAEESVIFTENSISAEGVSENVRIEAKFDNEVYPVIGSSIADGFAIRSISTERWETQVYKSGKKLFSAILVCSTDGQSFREDAELADGTRARMSLLYERCSKETSTNCE